MMRQLISENRLDYPTVVLREGGTPITVTITKNGPIAALITSAGDNVEVEMLTHSDLPMLMSPLPSQAR